MSAKLIFLGKLEDIAGVAEREVEPGPLDTILASLPQELAQALRGERIRLALNGTLLAGRSGLVLAADDELAFLPPVSGG